MPAAALVTNLSVHFKWGEANSLVWVTSLDEARPVANARVAVQDCHGKVLATAETDRQGIAHIGQLPGGEDLPNCYDEKAFESFEAPDYADYYANRALRSLDSGLFVVAQTDSDVSFVHSSWNEGIEAWRFRVPGAAGTPSVAAHTIFDRPLFRAGDTVHMKHVLRAETLEGFSLVGADERPDTLSIRHAGSDETYDLPLQWDDNGLAESTWEIPRAAKLGRYEVVLGRGGKNRHWTSGSFRVEEFRVPLLAAEVQLPAEPQIDAREVEAGVAVHYLAGGPAANLPVVLRSQIRPRPFAAPDGFEGFHFANGEVHEGMQRRREEEESSPATPGVHQRTALTLDAAGTARAAITDLPADEKPRELLAEVEFRDPNGELQTVASTVPLWPAAWMAGIRPQYWAGSEKALTADVAVLDTARPTGGRRARFGSTSSSASRTRTASAWSAGSTSTSTSARRARPAPSARDTPTPRGSCAARACRSTPGT